MKTKPLSKQQKYILRTGLDKDGRVRGGRYGWNANWLRALERRGLLRLEAEHTWDSDWRLTDAGFAAAKEADAEWRGSLSR
jgi:hypothetical protein